MWRPSASLERLQLRARVLARIRTFFSERGVMEVETPVLSAAAATDPSLSSFSACYQGPGAASGRELYLQTSPEFAMKRLLASGSGPIYQICKAFRNGESGRQHNPEFTMLEWYRPGFKLQTFMDEVEALVCELLELPSAERISYAELFKRHLGLDPHTASLSTLSACATENGLLLSSALMESDRDVWLALLLTHLIEPSLGIERPVFIYDFPVSQAMLARISPGEPPVAERFELYVTGVELANGFFELCDGEEQRSRFQADRLRRKHLGLPSVPIDEHLLSAMESGLPESVGVALGVDRLVMLYGGTDSIDEVIAFPLQRA